MSDNSALLKEIEKLKDENNKLKNLLKSPERLVITPPEFSDHFINAEKTVNTYFRNFLRNPDKAEIEINDERYVLMRSASLSYEFFDIIKDLYRNKPEKEAIRIGQNFLFDISHVLGKQDAKSFHQKMNVENPFDKMSAGPAMFAQMGWAKVEVLSESNPVPGEDYFLKFHHHNSFEAESWIDAGRMADIPVCIMNSGYSSGWCGESFNLELTAVEISCRAKGDDHCTFIMAPPNKIEQYLKIEKKAKEENYDVPEFFERKVVMEKLRSSLLQKEALIKEVHHRVKNNLQIIQSLLKLQQYTSQSENFQSAFNESIGRVSMMATIHEMIYANTDVDTVNIEHYCNYMLSSIIQVAHFGSFGDIETNYQLQLDEIHINQTMPLGLIINEVLQIFMKYKSNQKSILNFQINSRTSLSLAIHCPTIKEFEENEENLGFSLIESLTQQLDGKYSWNHKKESGLTFQLEFELI